VNIPLRTAALVAGSGLAVMAALAPIAVFVMLPLDAGVAALLALVVAGLDVAVGVALWPILRSGGDLVALISVAMRLVYSAVFATAGGSLARGDEALFHSTWDAGLLIFGAHLVLAGVAMMRSATMPTWIGVLVLIAGLGYAFDTTIAFAASDLAIEVGVVTFVGEVALIVWLIGWCGRARRRSEGDLR